MQLHLFAVNIIRWAACKLGVEEWLVSSVVCNNVIIIYDKYPVISALTLLVGQTWEN